MIDPKNITKFDRTTAELEEFLLFGIAVAGKRSTQTAKALDAFLSDNLTGSTPFQYIRMLDQAQLLVPHLIWARLSPYTQRERSFRWVSFLTNLDTVPVEVLETIPGIGPKTARFFVMHSRPDVRHAVLDTHILAWLREQGYDAPRQTPQSGKAYTRLEQAFLAECDKRGLTPADLDLTIWTERSQHGTGL